MIKLDMNTTSTSKTGRKGIAGNGGVIAPSVSQDDSAMGTLPVDSSAGVETGESSTAASSSVQ
jgi:hypothetical protein